MNSAIKVTIVTTCLTTNSMIASYGMTPSMSELRHQTFTYKTVGHLEIQAEVTRIDDDTARPVLVWIHGGAMMKGDRFGQWEKPFSRLMLEAGYIIVSIDYRLAPETKLPAIVEDITDACAWIRTEGPRLFGAKVDRLAVAADRPEDT